MSVTPSEVKPDEQVTISAMVSNNGGSEGSYTVILEINGAEEGRKEVIITGGGSQRVNFGVSRSSTGDYAVEVNGVLFGSFEVGEDVPPVPTSPIAPTRELNWWFIGAIIAACVVIGLSVYFVVRRKRSVEMLS